MQMADIDETDRRQEKTLEIQTHHIAKKANG